METLGEGFGRESQHSVQWVPPCSMVPATLGWIWRLELEYNVHWGGMLQAEPPGKLGSIRKSIAPALGWQRPPAGAGWNPPP